MKKKLTIFSNCFIISLLISCNHKLGSDNLVILWKDNEINQLMNEVSQDSLKIRIRSLQEFDTRYAHEKQVQVAEYIFNLLEQQNLDVKYLNYNWGDKTYTNIEVVLPGNKHPDNYFVIGAHYDSKSDISEKFAPGADDNASGIAALLELARIIQKYNMSNTIRIVFFSNEERGQHGSANYIKYLRGLPGHYLAGIIVDTIGYCSVNANLDIATKPEYKWLAVTANEILQLYNFSFVDLKIDKHCL